MPYDSQHAAQAFELTTRLDSLRDRDDAKSKELEALRQENDSLRHENQQLSATLKAVWRLYHHSSGEHRCSSAHKSCLHPTISTSPSSTGLHTPSGHRRAYQRPQFSPCIAGLALPNMHVYVVAGACRKCHGYHVAQTAIPVGHESFCVHASLAAAVHAFMPRRGISCELQASDSSKLLLATPNIVPPARACWV